MDNLKAAFEDVADWCERHLEQQRGREIGMIFGAMLRAYGRLAALPARLADCQRMPEARKLNARAEGFLGRLSTRFLLSCICMEMRIPMAEPTSLPTNIIYDTRARTPPTASSICVTGTTFPGISTPSRTTINRSRIPRSLQYRKG